MNSQSHPRRDRLPIVVVSLFLLLLPLAIPAAPIHGKKILAPNPATDWLVAKVRDSILKRLDLTNDQLRSIHQVIDLHRDDLWEEMVAAKEARLLLLDEMRAASIDTVSIRDAHSRVADTELQLWIHLAEMMQEVRPLLTPDQLAEVDLLVEEFAEGAELRFEDLEEVFANGELLGKKWRTRADKDAAR